MWRFLVVLLLIPAVAAHGDDDHGEPAWQSGILLKDETYSHTFTDTRTHGYSDGTTGAIGGVRVVADGPMTAAVAVTSKFDPAMVEIGPGGIVTWTIMDDDSHTIISQDEAGHADEESPLGFMVPLAAIAAVLVFRRRA